MSEVKAKVKFNPATIKTIEVSEIPAKASKGIWMSWIPILQDLVKNPTKAKTVTEKEASLPAIRNQIAKAVKTANIAGIVLNSRNINKVQTLFISYKKPVTVKKQ
jgi:hypothetical protein